MNILIISPGILPVPAVDGGAVENLIEIFLEENEKYNKNNIVVYSCKNDKAEKKANDNFKKTKFRFIKTYGIKYKILKNIRWIINKLPGVYIGNEYINEIIKEIKERDEEEKYDVIVVENSPMHIIPLSKLFKDKLYLHMHNDFIKPKSKKSRVILKKCKKVIAVSDYIAHKIRSVADYNNVETVINGIKIEAFDKTYDNSEELKNKYNIRQNDFVFMYTGRVTRDKGVLELLDAFKDMTEKYDDIKLLVVGSSFFNNGKKNKYIKSLEKIADSIKDKVVFTGYIKHDELYKIYSIADVQVVPSKFEDPCPLSVIEGVVSGKPLIVSNCGGIPKLVNKNNAEFVENNAEFVKNLQKAMMYMYNNEERMRNMREYSKEQIGRFSLKTYYDNLLSKFSEE